MKENKYLIIGLFALLLISGAMAYSEKLTMQFITDNYKEECLEYDKIPFNRTLYYCDSNYRFLMICDYKNKGMGESYNKKDIDCNCPNIANRTVVDYREGKCIKYHLVREVESQDD